MADSLSSLALAAGIGCVAGMRSMAAPALLSRQLTEHPHRGPAGRLLASPPVASVLPVLAAGEMVADKTPFIPDRTEAVPVAGRALMGALCGAAICHGTRSEQMAGALVGAAAAVGATFLAYTIRRRAGEALPDLVLGMAEDALVLALGARIASAAAPR